MFLYRTGKVCAGNTEFKDNPSSTHSYDLNLASQNITLKDLTVPMYTITIAPNEHDRGYLT